MNRTSATLVAALTLLGLEERRELLLGQQQVLQGP